MSRLSGTFIASQSLRSQATLARIFWRENNAATGTRGAGQRRDARVGDNV